MRLLESKELNTKDTEDTNSSDSNETKKHFTYDTLDSLLLDLKIISKIEEGDKICVSNNSNLSIDNSTVLQSVKRWYNNDSREATIDYIENTLNNTLFITNLILKNETEKQLSNKQKKDNLVQSISEMNIIENLHFKEGNSQLLKRFYLEMINATDGLKNLKVTYQTDVSISSKIQIIIDKENINFTCRYVIVGLVVACLAIATNSRRNQYTWSIYRSRMEWKMI